MVAPAREHSCPYTTLPHARLEVVRRGDPLDLVRKRQGFVLAPQIEGRNRAEVDDRRDKSRLSGLAHELVALLQDGVGRGRIPRGQLEVGLDHPRSGGMLQVSQLEEQRPSRP